MKTEPFKKYITFEKFEKQRLKTLRELNPQSVGLLRELASLEEKKVNAHTILMYLVKCKDGEMSEKEFIDGLWWHGERHPDQMDEELLRYSANEFGHELYFSRDKRTLLPVGTPKPVNVTVYQSNNDE
ncbi:TPA: hypothetical protein ACGU88_000897 [Vibrio vulnificus]|uniref:hypothetical protein n=1 Tax=Vibrio vulnificus TaxID=672 RepID=UPI0028935269|nr:hypothetical protein [Vibrio vulnificus]WNJ72077.1 hypothetical protein RI132_20295 [Vibrio vulnificus]